jgi:hypothetical protein
MRNVSRILFLKISKTKELVKSRMSKNDQGEIEAQTSFWVLTNYFCSE